MKRLYPVSLAFGAATVLASLAALFLDKSLGYRIGPLEYAKYMWAERLVGLSVGLALLALVCALVAGRGRFSVCLPFLGLIPLFFIGGVHSGPNPEAWCSAISV